MKVALEAAFNMLLKIHAREVTIERPGKVGPVAIRVSPSSYFRSLVGAEEISISGREFVIAKSNLDSVSYPAPRAGDRIVDPDLGLIMIDEVREMYSIGGAIVGYRVKSS